MAPEGNQLIWSREEGVDGCWMKQKNHAVDQGDLEGVLCYLLAAFVNESCAMPRQLQCVPDDWAPAWHYGNILAVPSKMEGSR